MALRPNQNHKAALTENQVLQVRDLYFHEQLSYRKLAEQFGVTKRVIEKAVQGIGPYYSGIQDRISESTKKNRMPAYHQYSIRSTKKYAKDKNAWMKKLNPHQRSEMEELDRRNREALRKKELENMGFNLYE